MFISLKCLISFSLQCFHAIVSSVLWCWMTVTFTCCSAHSFLNSQPMISNMQQCHICCHGNVWNVPPVSCTLVTQDNCTQPWCSVHGKSKHIVCSEWKRRSERNIRRTSRSRRTLGFFCDGQQRLWKRSRRKHCSTVSPFVEGVKPNTGTALLCDRHAAPHPAVWTYNPTHWDSHGTSSVAAGFKTQKSLHDTTTTTCTLTDQWLVMGGFSFSSLAKKNNFI